MNTEHLFLNIILCAVAFFAVWCSYPLIMKLARKWDIIDNPDARKLQRTPIPVLGGLAVYIGIAIGTIIMLSQFYQFSLLVMLIAMGVLLVIGIFDDKYGLSVWIRFVVEILIVLGVIAFNGNMIDNLHGLFGLYEISSYIALPLSVFVGVGIVNAINLIDGVDGYSSGYITISCIFFSVIFYCSQIYALSQVCLICACSLIPFFMHNVFGVKSKMFIGDGGTLMLGVLMVALLFSTLKMGSLCETLEGYNISLVALCLAILAVPVIDTLRVMTYRMVKGLSPFKPDKTHLHHLFIDLHFFHFAAAFICILLNGVVVAAWLVGWILGLGINAQFFVVCSAMILVDPVLYAVLRYHEKRKSPLYMRICEAAERIDLEHSNFWKKMRKFVDRKYE